MASMLENIKSWTSLLPVFSIANMLEIIIIAVIVYELLSWIMSTRAFTLLKGIFVILAFTFIAFVFHLNTILWIIERISTIAVIALVVIFQPELRKALEQLGTNYFIGSLVGSDNKDNMMTKESAAQISSAVFQMAKVKTGALIVIEQHESLDEFIKTGINVNGDISSGLIINIFEKNTPLHDGAVIIRENKIVAATCYLPLSQDPNISKDLGTRHRAAYGISEVSDSITIVVSEETGRVSYIYKGILTRIGSEEELNEFLFARINKEEVRSFNLRLRLRSGQEKEQNG